MSSNFGSPDIQLGTGDGTVSLGNVTGLVYRIESGEAKNPSANDAVSVKVAPGLECPNEFSTPNLRARVLRAAAIIDM